MSTKFRQLKKLRKKKSKVNEGNFEIPTALFIIIYPFTFFRARGGSKH